jgi:hypothetical protein
MDVFLCNLRPRSVRAKTPERYKDGIRDAFQLFCQDSTSSPGPLYASIYYFHRRPSEQDADNISKPILDALEGLAYEDDRVVRFRQAAMFSLDSDPLSDLNLSGVPEEILESLLEKLEREDHVLYIELGRLSFQQFRFGYELMEA